MRLNPAAELFTQLVSPGLDDRVVGDSHDGARGPIESHGDLGSLSKQLVKFFLQRDRRSIHESSTCIWRFLSPNRCRAADYHK